MTRSPKCPAVNGSALLLGLGGFTAPSFTDRVSDHWQFDAPAYAYLRQFSGSVTFLMGRSANIKVDLHLDVGTGGSQLTWQGIAGAAYRFSGGEVVADWRYLEYLFSRHSPTRALNGRAIGVGFRW